MNTSRPLLNVAMVAMLIPALASSVFAAQKETPPTSAPSKKGDIAKGKILFRHYCAVCHGVAGKGDGPNASHLDPRPADLSDPEYMESATDQSIFAVIDRGGRALDLPPTMPMWGKTLSREQISDLVAYVQTLSKPSSAEVKQPTRLTEIKAPGGTECRLCHVKAGEHRPIAPDLGQEGSKLNKNWVYAFLRKPTKIRPVGYMPLTRSVMPDFQLTEDEALALTEYMMSRQDPRIPRAGSAEFKPSPETVKEGKRLYEDVYGCDGCHQAGNKGGIAGPNLSEAGKRLKTEWIMVWLKNPTALRHDSPMPNFGLQEREIRALSAYVLSLSEGPAPPPLPATSKTSTELIEKGKHLARDKNCAGCHIIDINHDQDRPEQTSQKIPGKNMNERSVYLAGEDRSND